MICISRWRRLSVAPEAAKTSVPSKVTLPPVAGMRRRSVRPTVVLPQPDSPTRPRVSPRSMWKETSSTALTCPWVSWRSPDLMGNQVLRCWTERRGWVEGRLGMGSEGKAESGRRKAESGKREIGTGIVGEWEGGEVGR